MMGQLVYFCAGANANILPAKQINALLLNVPDNGADGKAIRSAKNLVKISGAKHLMLDSGGFTLFTGQRDGLEIGSDPARPIRQPGKINLTPSHVIRAVVDIQPDIMVGLDFPIDKIDDPERREIEFRKKLGFNVSWAIETAELRKKHFPQIGFFMPVQCYTLNHLDLFIRTIQGIQYDGFSMPIRNLGVAEITLFLMRFRELGIKQVHLLGMTKIFPIALCAYMARHFFDWVSFDSTTWNAKYGHYLNLHDLSLEKVDPAMVIDESIRMDCDCPWCKGKTFTYIKNLPLTERTAFMRCHNHWVMEKAVEESYANAGTISQLRTFLMRRCRDKEEVEELCRCLAIAEALKDSPFEQWKELLGKNSQGRGHKE
jgi:tRNA-guanine family transglycosylase